MNYLDLFSGIGGFSLGFKKAGFQFENHYASEIDKYARSIYERQIHGSIQLGNIKKIKNGLEKIDIITGGFPCQTFSIAGGRRGFDDTRGTLFFEIERLAEIYRPCYMVLENVKGLYSHEQGNTIRVILEKLRGLNYFVQLLLLNTKDFDVPQNRERCFFICSTPEERRPEILHLRERKTEVACSEITKNQSQGYRVYNDDCSVTLASEAGGVGAKTGLYAIPCLSPDRVEKRQNGRRFKDNGDPMFTLTAQDRHGILIQDMNIRRLTPIECERLQGFPDDWTKYGKDGELISDSQRYKCCGNAVTVDVVKEIAKAIKEVI